MIDVTRDMWWLGPASEAFSIFESIAVIVGAVVAVATINAWRKQNLGIRKVALGEQALLIFYELTDNLNFVRKQLPAPEGADGVSAFEAQRSEYYNRYMTLEALEPLVSSLAGQRPMFRVYFGSDAGAPFDDIIAITRKLGAEVREVFVMVPAEGKEFQEKPSLLRAIGWSNHHRPDSTDRAIAKALFDMETICKPVLQGRK